MELSKKERTIYRRQVTCNISKLEASLDQEPLNEIEVRNYLQILEINAGNLGEIDRQIRKLYLTAEISEEDMLNDIDETESRWAKYSQVKSRVETVLAARVECKEECTTGKTDSCKSLGETVIERTLQRKFKLPVIELKQFDGSIENWLGFWGQFRKIHDDCSLDDDDKFHYLLQATEPGSNARELVESFPPSGTNYHRAVKHMKERFANDELLIQIYIRKLLEIVLSQGSATYNLRALYDKLNTQLRALEALGVTSDKYAAMLYPLIESAIPENVLRIWQRTVQECKKNQLENLLTFLRMEVESEEKVQIAKKGFKEYTALNEPTTSCILAGNKIEKKVEFTSDEKNRNCVWCNRITHNSSECIAAKNMSLEERKNHLRSRNGCLICFKIGHFAKTCRSYPKCWFCLQRHYMVMCPTFPKFKDEVSHGHSVENVLLTYKNSITFLQTVVVNLVHNNKNVKVRALLDSGSQRSYICKQIAKELGLKPISNVNLTHCLFGGIETNLERHNVHTVCVQESDGKFECAMTVLDKDAICGYLPRLNDPLLLKQLQNLNIILNDVDDSLNKVGMLIGADYSGLLFTGEVVQLENNLVAMRTKLGWVLQGKASNMGIDILTNSTLCCNVADLWDLESIGIKDPVQVKNNDILEREIMDFFKDTIRVNSEGRYEVSLPWKEDANLTDNKILAHKRLIATTKRLIASGNFEEYDRSLKEWEQCGIIEEVVGDDLGHYLPHHAVLKESSVTTRVILSLRRFTSRRGRVRVIYSDNGINFVGTKNLLRDIDWNEIEGYSAMQKISWRLILPSAPWWGGWCE